MAYVYELIVGLLQSLGFQQQLLIELFPRAQSDVFYLDIHIRLKSAETYHLPGHVIYTHRLAHIQHKDLAALGIGPGLEYQGDCLRYGHKEAGHPLIRHRNRAPLGDLFSEKGYNASVAAQHIAETHCNIFSVVLAVHGLHHHLTHTFGGTHHIGRVHSLIGGNQDEKSGIEISGGLCHIVGAEDIVLDGLGRAVLHQRHMLVSRGMTDHIRPVGVEHITHPALIPDRAYKGHKIQLGIAADDLVGEVHEVVEVQVAQITGDVGKGLAAAVGAAGVGVEDEVSLGS